MAQTAPDRSALHDALEVFVGKWTANGTSYGGTDQTGEDPKAHGQRWTSTHESVWHTGRFFVVENERADIEGYRFDTLSVLGLDDQGKYFCRSFENHGFYRDYQVNRDGNIWTYSGPTERARIEFSADGREQTISWEWKPEDHWLPLCDRTAVRAD